MPLPLMLAVQKPLHLRCRGLVLVLEWECGRLTCLALPATCRRGTRTWFLGATLGDTIHKICGVDAILSTEETELVITLDYSAQKADDEDEVLTGGESWSDGSPF